MVQLHKVQLKCSFTNGRQMAARTVWGPWSDEKELCVRCTCYAAGMQTLICWQPKSIKLMSWCCVHTQCSWCEAGWSARHKSAHSLYLVATTRGLHLTSHPADGQGIPCTCPQCSDNIQLPSRITLVSDESFLWWDFKHAVHLQPGPSQLLNTGAVRTLWLTFLPCREHHEGQTDDEYQHTEAEQGDCDHQPGDPLFVGLFLQTATI